MRDMTTLKDEFRHVEERLGSIPSLPPLPRARYVDETFYQLELQYIFKRSWLLIGHASEFTQPGQYRTVDLPGGPVVVVRGGDGVFRAFLNSCRHRGATVLRADQGCTKMLTCQYHGWGYDLTGKLVHVTSAESFPDLDPSDYPLIGLRCELWGGLIFVNFDLNAPPLLEDLEPLASRYSHLCQEDPARPLRLIARKTWEITANWKAVVEAFQEAYHVQYIHPALSQAIRADDLVNVIYPHGHGNTYYTYRDQVDWSQSKLNIDGTREPAPNERLMPGFDKVDEIVLNHAPEIFPNAHLVCSPTDLTTMLMWPLDAGRCLYELSYFGIDWQDKEIPRAYTSGWEYMKVLTAEDLANMNSIQKSLVADPSRSVPLGSREVMIYDFNCELDRRIGVDRIPNHLRVPDLEVLKDFIVE